MYKRTFEYEEKNSYGIEKQKNMMRIHNNEVKNVAECNLLHVIINPLKRAKN